VWIGRLALELLHHEQLAEHGGLAGIRDENALEAVVARPRNLFSYENQTDLLALAASLGYGLARRHVFADGNKRIGFVAMAVFLDLNGRDVVPAEPDVVQTMRAVAADEMSEPGLAEWLADQVYLTTTGRVQGDSTTGSGS
jgi:death-on-curing protein